MSTFPLSRGTSPAARSDQRLVPYGRCLRTVLSAFATPAKKLEKPLSVALGTASRRDLVPLNFPEPADRAFLFETERTGRACAWVPRRRAELREAGGRGRRKTSSRSDPEHNRMPMSRERGSRDFHCIRKCIVNVLEMNLRANRDGIRLCSVSLSNRPEPIEIFRDVPRCEHLLRRGSSLSEIRPQISRDRNTCWVGTSVRLSNGVIRAVRAS